MSEDLSKEISSMKLEVIHAHDRINALQRNFDFYRDHLAHHGQRIDALENPNLAPSLKAFQDLRKTLGEAPHE